MELNVFQPWRVRIKEHCLSKQMQIIKINRRKHSELKELEELNLQISRYMTHTHTCTFFLSHPSVVFSIIAPHVCVCRSDPRCTHTLLSLLYVHVFFPRENLNDLFFTSAALFMILIRQACERLVNDKCVWEELDSRLTMEYLLYLFMFKRNKGLDSAIQDAFYDLLKIPWGL